MSIFKKIKNAVTGEELMRDLCEHLRQIGVNATLLESGSPEAIGPRLKKGPFASEQVLGNIRIEGQHIDLLQVGRRGVGGGGEDGGGGTEDQPFYVVRAKVEGVERNLEAKGKPIKKGFFSREVVGFQWEGGDLARRLNADADLKTMVLSTGLVDIEVRCDKNNQCVRIWGYLGFPSREAFDIYDRIASHIRSITGSQP
jgi:hypothetical protein